MSTRVTRPRSRRGRHAPPGELDPVAESSEEVEAASGSSGLGSAPSLEDGKPQLPDSRAEASGQDLGNRTDKEADGDSSRGLTPAPEGPHEPAKETHQASETQAREMVPTVPAEPGDVFQTLQNALSSLEATAAAWRHHPSSCLEEAEGGTERASRPSGEKEGAGGCQREAARLAERNAWLRLAVGSRADELTHVQASLQAAQAEKAMLQREVQELQDALLRLESSPPPFRGQVDALASGCSSSRADEEPRGTQDPFSLARPPPQRLQSDSGTHTVGPLPSQPLIPDINTMEAQMEQLRGSIEKHKCFNRLLSAVLQGYKGQCEGLSMQLGQREAEATGLRLALQYSEQCEEAYAALLTVWEAGSGAEAPLGDLEVAEKEAQRLLAQEEAALDGRTVWNLQPSTEGSSVDRPTAQEVAAQLQGFVQRLQAHRALLKIPPDPGPTLAPISTVPHAEAMVQAILRTQPGPCLPPLEKMQIQQDLAATRETLADLMLQLQLVRREKRGLELREAALRAQGPAHVILLEQLQWELVELRTCGAKSSGEDSSEGGSSGDEEWSQGLSAVPGGSKGIDGSQLGKVSDPEELTQELSASLARSLGLWKQLQSLREELEQLAQKGRARRVQNAELNSDLCRAHSALVLAFRGAHRKQEEQQRKLEEQVILMKAQQDKELARLEATARTLRRPPRPGETIL